MRGWSVPGSILLAGEYRVTEEGGRGIALAAGGRAQLLYMDDLALTVEGRFPGSRMVWSPGEQKPSENDLHQFHRSLPESVYRTLGASSLRTGKAIVDTSGFFAHDGRKWGLGSSAAAALLTTRFLSEASGEDVLKTALIAHRKFQGDQGSGYDLYTSAYGGAGLFMGGNNPSWTSFCWPKNLAGYLIRGPSPVCSVPSVEQYFRWISEVNTQADVLCQQLDEEIITFYQRLTSNEESEDVLTHWAELGRLGVYLGDAIGVPARPHRPWKLGRDIFDGTRKNAAVKCVGAGDELALLLYHDGALSVKEMEVLNAMVEQGEALILNVESRGWSRIDDTLQ